MPAELRPKVAAVLLVGTLWFPTVVSAAGFDVGHSWPSLLF
jgi:hypothetical protein